MAALFQTGGFDIKHFKQIGPTWAPPLPYDELTEWRKDPTTGVHNAIEIRAAAYGGKPVYFQVIHPGSSEISAGEPIGQSGAGESAIPDVKSGNIPSVLVSLCMFFGAAAFARRNIRLGRGDRNGGFRLFIVACLVTMVLWLLWGHFPADAPSVFRMFLRALGESLVLAGFVWLSYMAAEPYLRRHWPNVLISWARLISGKVTDPLVGQDFLVGTLAGVVAAALSHLETSSPYWINVQGIIPSDINLNFLDNMRRFLGTFIYALQQSFPFGLAYPILLLVALAIVRKRWLAVAITIVLFIIAALNPGNILVDLPITTAQIILLFAVFLRFGLVAVVISQFVLRLIAAAPLTLNSSLWYADRSFFILGFVLAIALYGLFHSQGGSKLLGNLSLEKTDWEPRRTCVGLAEPGSPS